MRAFLASLQAGTSQEGGCHPRPACALLFAPFGSRRQFASDVLIWRLGMNRTLSSAPRSLLPDPPSQRLHPFQQRAVPGGLSGRSCVGTSLPRCSTRGCVFPAASVGGNLCLVHLLAEEEPKHFLSVQPSSLCLDRARFEQLSTAPAKSRGCGRPRFRFQDIFNKVA